MEERNTYKIYEGGNLGEVQIADDVVASIAGIAAMEVEGVKALTAGTTAEIASKFGVKKASKGVKVSVEDNNVTIGIGISVEYGSNIPEVSAKVQEKIKNTVENMTGLNVTVVNVKVSALGADE